MEVSLSLLFIWQKSKLQTGSCVCGACVCGVPVSTHEHMRVVRVRYLPWQLSWPRVSCCVASLARQFALQISCHCLHQILKYRLATIPASIYVRSGDLSHLTLYSLDCFSAIPPVLLARQHCDCPAISSAPLCV